MSDSQLLNLICHICHGFLVFFWENMEKFHPPAYGKAHDSWHRDCWGTRSSAGIFQLWNIAFESTAACSAQIWGMWIFICLCWVLFSCRWKRGSRVAMSFQLLNFPFRLENTGDGPGAHEFWPPSTERPFQFPFSAQLPLVFQDGVVDSWICIVFYVVLVSETKMATMWGPQDS